MLMLKTVKRQLDFDVITSGDSANGSAYPEGTILQLKASEKRIIEKSNYQR